MFKVTKLLLWARTTIVVFDKDNNRTACMNVVVVIHMVVRIVVVQTPSSRRLDIVLVLVLVLVEKTMTTTKDGWMDGSIVRSKPRGREREREDGVVSCEDVPRCQLNNVPLG